MARKLCENCGIRKQYTGSKGIEQAPSLSESCNYCYEAAGWENTHNDEGHDENEVVSGCWICHPELNLAKLPAGKKGTEPKVQGDRRAQLNHKGHSHPQTPAARKACKEAFWAAIKVSKTTDPALVGQLMAEWNHQCDNNGKTATWKVVPLGPKGGVINQLKATKHLMKACANAAHYDEIIESGMCSTCGKEK